MQVLKIELDDCPNALIVEQGKSFDWCLESMLTDHPIFDGDGMGLSVGSSLTITIQVIDMPEEEFKALDSWEPN